VFIVKIEGSAGTVWIAAFWREYSAELIVILLELPALLLVESCLRNKPKKGGIVVGDGPPSDRSS